MKALYLTLTFLLTVGLSFTQTSNWDFETWSSGVGYDSPNNWENINQYASILGVTPSVEKITSGAPQGSYAAKLTTNSCANCAAVIGPGTDTLAGLITQNSGYTVVPQTATFMYKYNGVAGDMGLFYIEVTSWDAVGDSAIVVAAGVDSLLTVNSWSSKTVQFYPGPGASLTPDTIKVTFLSSAGALGIGSVRPQIGSELSVDALSLNTQVSIAENSEENIVTVLEGTSLNIYFETEETQIELIDLNGRMLEQKRGINQVSVDVSEYPKGIYIIRYSSRESFGTKKVFIQ